MQTVEGHPTMSNPYPFATLLLIIQPLMSGCAAFSSNDPLAVRSTPSGATIYIMQRPIGKTPMEITQQTLYPATYDPAKHTLYGEILLKKEGCGEYRHRISSHDIVTGIDAILSCGDGMGDTSNGGAVEKETVQNDASTPGAKQRLIEIKRLRDEGLINDEEYDAIRHRVLDSL